MLPFCNNSSTLCTPIALSSLDPGLPQNLFSLNLGQGRGYVLVSYHENLALPSLWVTVEALPLSFNYWVPRAISIDTLALEV